MVMVNLFENFTKQVILGGHVDMTKVFECHELVHLSVHPCAYASAPPRKTKPPYNI